MSTDTVKLEVFLLEGSYRAHSVILPDAVISVPYNSAVWSISSTNTPAYLRKLAREHPSSYRIVFVDAPAELYGPHLWPKAQRSDPNF